MKEKMDLHCHGHFYTECILACDSNDLSCITIRLCNLLREKTLETFEHCERLIELSALIANEMGLDEDHTKSLKLTAKFHDIGKVAVPDYILLKPAALCPEEMEIMKTHAEIGYRILCRAPELKTVAKGVLCHHERWDGKGYPHGLKATDIPMNSRIISVVDAYDAMVSDRVYSKAKSKQEAIGELHKNAGTQFDPDIVRVFVEKLLIKGQNT